jgi:hypothetical protein
LNVRNVRSPIMKDKIIIIDDEGKEVTYTNFQDFVNFVDCFYMPFLPDNYSYRIEESDNERT